MQNFTRIWNEVFFELGFSRMWTLVLTTRIVENSLLGVGALSKNSKPGLARLQSRPLLDRTTAKDYKSQQTTALYVLCVNHRIHTTSNDPHPRSLYSNDPLRPFLDVKIVLWFITEPRRWDVFLYSTRSVPSVARSILKPSPINDPKSPSCINTRQFIKSLRHCYNLAAAASLPATKIPM